MMKKVFVKAIVNVSLHTQHLRELNKRMFYVKYARLREQREREESLEVEQA